jgi:hypothetical protein
MSEQRHETNGYVGGEQNSVPEASGDDNREARCTMCGDRFHPKPGEIELEDIERRLRILGLAVRDHFGGQVSHIVWEEIFDLAGAVRFAWSAVTGEPAYPEDDDEGEDD